MPARALAALGELEAHTHSDVIIGALEDPVASVRIAAVKALEALGDASLGKHLVPRFKDGDRQVKHRALRAAGLLKAKQVAAEVAAFLDDPDEQARAGAIVSLGRMDATEYFPRLRAMKDDPSLAVSMAVAYALARTKDEAHAARVVEFQKGLSDPDPVKRSVAAESIRLWNVDELADPLAHALAADSDAEVRRCAALALGKIGRAHTAALVTGLNDAEAKVRAACLVALKELVAGDTWWWSQFAQRRDRADAVAKRLTDASAEVRAAAVEALEKFGAREHARSVARRLGDEDAEVRAAALVALATFEERDYASLVGALLDDRDWKVREAAARATGVLRGSKHIPALMKLLSDEMRPVREASRKALVELRGPFTAKELYDIAKPAVVRIEAKALEDGEEVAWAGSGFFIHRKGVVMTNRHVVDPKGDRRSNVTVTLHDGRQFKTEPRWIIHVGLDLAVIMLVSSREETFPVLDFVFPWPDDRPKIGHAVMAVGHPKDLKWSMTSGTVSQIRVTGKNKGEEHQPGGEVWIQTDTTLNSGNSGGPLLNMHGLVVGVVTRKLIGDGVEGLSFALAPESFFTWVTNVDTWDEEWK